MIFWWPLARDDCERVCFNGRKDERRLVGISAIIVLAVMFVTVRVDCAQAVSSTNVQYRYVK